jgi:hypothetical protein
MTQPRNMICPSTGALCVDGRCKIGHCLIAIRDRIEKSEAEVKRADQEWADEILRAVGL